MTRAAKIIVALLCMVCVLILCIAPFVDIPVTVLKSLQVVILLMLSLTGCALLLSGALHSGLVAPRQLVLRVNSGPLIRPLPIETNCVQQC